MASLFWVKLKWYCTPLTYIQSCCKIQMPRKLYFSGSLAPQLKQHTKYQLDNGGTLLWLQSLCAPDFWMVRHSRGNRSWFPWEEIRSGDLWLACTIWFRWAQVEDSSRALLSADPLPHIRFPEGTHCNPGCFQTSVTPCFSLRIYVSLPQHGFLPPTSFTDTSKNTIILTIIMQNHSGTLKKHF